MGRAGGQALQLAQERLATTASLSATRKRMTRPKTMTRRKNLIPAAGAASTVAANAEVPAIINWHPST